VLTESEISGIVNKVNDVLSSGWGKVVILIQDHAIVITEKTVSERPSNEKE